MNRQLQQTDKTPGQLSMQANHDNLMKQNGCKLSIS